MDISIKIIAYLSLSIFFLYYLCNYAEIFDKPRKIIFSVLSDTIIKVAQCGLCFSFWTMLILCLFYNLYIYIFAVPTVVLFMDFTFKKLKK